MATEDEAKTESEIAKAINNLAAAIDRLAAMYMESITQEEDSPLDSAKTL